MSGSDIRRAREVRGMTQRRLAQILGTTEDCVSRYERGASTPGADRLRDIADALRVSMDDLWPKPNPFKMTG